MPVRTRFLNFDFGDRLMSIYFNQSRLVSRKSFPMIHDQPLKARIENSFDLGSSTAYFTSNIVLRAGPDSKAVPTGRMMMRVL